MTAHPEQKQQPTRNRATTKILAGLVTVACVTAGGYLLYERRAQAQDTSAPEQAAPEQRVAVVTTPAAMRDFERSLVVQGNVEAKNFAMVSPRVAGTIEMICVDEGDAVTANETKLFQTDAVALEESVQIGRHNLTVATCAKREALASLEKTRADFHKAELDYGRFKRLFEQQAVTADAFEQQESRYQQLTASVKLAEAQVDLTAAREDQAKAALAIAEKNLADATIYAPISGTVSQRLQEPGEMGNPGKPVLRIDDATVVEVAAYLPAEYYAEVRPGQTTMKIQISGVNPGTQTVTYKSPTIDARLRAFEVKCVLTNPPEGIAPGAMAQIAVVLESRKGLGIPSAAIQQRGGRAVAFVVTDGVTHQVPVTTGIESDGWTEIRDGDLAENAAVVTMGQYMVEEGTPVTVRPEGK